MLTEDQIKEIAETLKDMDHFLRQRLMPTLDRSSSFDFMRDCPDFVKQIKHLMSYRIDLNDIESAALDQLIDETQSNINAWIDTLRRFVSAKKPGFNSFDETKLRAEISAAHKSAADAFTSRARQFRTLLFRNSDTISNNIALIHANVFICYRRDNSQSMVDQLYRSLSQKVENVFRDIDSIRGGEAFSTVIKGRLQNTDYVLVVIGSRWLAKPWFGQPRLFDSGDHVRFDIEAALTSHARVIPIVLPPAKMPRRADLPTPIASLSDLSAIPVRLDPDFDRDVERLVRNMASRAPGAHHEADPMQ